MKFTLAIAMTAALSLLVTPVSAQQYFETAPVEYSTGQSSYSQAKSYKEAYRDAQEGDKPLLVLVTATWCPPCQVMKSTTIPALMRKNSFKNFHYATVDLDAEEELGRQLIGNRGLPQLIMFEKENDKWVRRYLRGIQTVQTVEAFVAQASSFRTANAGSSATTFEK